MPTIRTAAGKGAKLTPTEADSNMKRTPVAKSSNYALDASHNREVHELGGSITTVTLPVVSSSFTETGDWSITLINTLNTPITIDRNGQTIDGVASDKILRVGGRIIICMTASFDGFYTILGYSPVYGGRILRQTPVAVGSSGWDDDVFWGTEEYDTASCISSYASGTLITVPSDASWMRAILHTIFNSNATGIRGCRLLSCDAYGVSINAIAYSTVNAFSGAANAGPNLDTGWLQVTPGTYYKGGVYCDAAGISLQTTSFLAVEFK